MKFLGNSIEYNINAPLDDDATEAFNTTIEGTIYAFDNNNPDQEDAEVAGKLEAVNIDMAGCQFMSLFDICDQEQATCDLYEDLFDLDDDEEFNERVQEVFDEPAAHRNLLFIRSISIKPKFRGQFLDLAAIYRTIQQFCEIGGVVAIRVHPYLFEQQTDPNYRNATANKQDIDEQKSLEKLQNHYKRLGFKLFPGSNIMLINLELKRPTLEEAVSK